MPKYRDVESIGGREAFSAPGLLGRRRVADDEGDFADVWNQAGEQSSSQRGHENGPGGASYGMRPQVRLAIPQDQTIRRTVAGRRDKVVFRGNCHSPRSRTNSSNPGYRC